VRYHVEISPQAEQDIRAMGALLRRSVAYAVRSLLQDPDADREHFALTPPLRAILVGNVVAVFRFMAPEELPGLRVPGRYVVRVLQRDELEEIAGELAREHPPTPGPSVRAAAAELLAAIRETLARQGP